ncbi:MAG: hypothetical protein ABMB14_31985 [Myxococcota bacterium]
MVNRHSLWVGVLLVAACDPRVGYEVNVVVGAATLAELPDPESLAVRLDAALEGESVATTEQPLDGTTDEQAVWFQFMFEEGSLHPTCTGRYTATLVRIDGEGSVPLDPPIAADASGECGTESNLYSGEATL